MREEPPLAKSQKGRTLNQNELGACFLPGDVRLPKMVEATEPITADDLRS